MREHSETRRTEVETEYVFSTEEMVVLLAAAGCKRLFGFNLGDMCVMGKAEVLRCVHGLYKRGILECRDDNEKLTTTATLRRILDICVTAKEILRVTRLHPEEIPFAVCYKGSNRWALLRPCDTLPHGWRVQSVSAEEIVAVLEASGCLPANPMDVMPERVQRKQENGGYAGETIGVCTLLLEKMEAGSGALLHDARLYKDVLEDHLQLGCRKGGETKVYEYGEKILLRWLENGLED